MKYLLDTNVFIEADKRYYSEKIVPSFWKFLEKDDEIFTIDEVIEEIKGNDNLLNVIKKVKRHSIIDANRDITEYIKKNYTVEEARKFLEVADFLLVCLAKEGNFTIVTQEKKKGEDAKKVAIPNICEKFEILYMDTFEMLKKKNINLSSYNLKK